MSSWLSKSCRMAGRGFPIKDARLMKSIISLIITRVDEIKDIFNVGKRASFFPRLVWRGRWVKWIPLIRGWISGGRWGWFWGGRRGGLPWFEAGSDEADNVDDTRLVLKRQMRWITLIRGWFWGGRRGKTWTELAPTRPLLPNQRLLKHV